MAQLRITMISRTSNNALVVSSKEPVFYDQVQEVALDGPLDVLLRNVAECTRLTNPDGVSLAFASADAANTTYRDREFNHAHEP